MDSKEGKCSYHLCRKETTVYKCEYCEDYFCEEHLPPTLVGMPNYQAETIKELLYMEEWKNKDGHPCPPFVLYVKEMEEKRKEEYKKALEAIIEAPPQPSTPEYSPRRYNKDWENDEEWIEEDEQEEDSSEEKDNKLPWIYIIIAIVIGLIIILAGISAKL